MSLSKIKTLAIIALAMINVFFLAIIAVDTYEETSVNRRAAEDACAILRNNGIELYPENVVSRGTLPAIRTSRIAEREAEISSVFLGNADAAVQGVITVYENPGKGTAEFFSAGDFEIALSEGAVAAEVSPQSAVREYMRLMKIDASELTVENSSENTTVTAVSAYRGAGIFNCRIVFVFNSGELRSVRGRYAAGMTPIEDGALELHAGTALLGFMAAVRRGEIECSDIYRAEAGYRFSAVGSFGEGALTPVWLIAADSGSYLCDGVTIEAYQG